MYKIYTSCLKSFLSDHCEHQNIIASEQLVGNKEERGIGMHKKAADK